MMGQERVITCVGFLILADQHFLQLHREILGLCSGFSESQMEIPSTTSKANPSGLTQKKNNK